MSKSQSARRLTAALAASFAAVSMLAPLPSLAREGSSSKSVGGGVKCFNVVTTDANGKVKVTQICSKSI